MLLPKEKSYTAEDYWALPEGRRAELIDGVLYDMAPPYRIHQELLMQLSNKIFNHIRENKGECKVYPAPFAVNLTGDDHTWVEPDISVICDRDKLSDRGCEGAPDWIIEIVSKSTQRMDYSVKLFKYRTANVREYWIVNPVSRTVIVYDFEKEETSGQYSFDEDIPVSIWSDFSINIAAML